MNLVQRLDLMMFNLTFQIFSRATDMINAAFAEGLDRAASALCPSQEWGGGVIREKYSVLHKRLA